MGKNGHQKKILKNFRYLIDLKIVVKYNSQARFKRAPCGCLAQRESIALTRRGS